MLEVACNWLNQKKKTICFFYEYGDYSFHKKFLGSDAVLDIFSPD